MLKQHFSTAFGDTQPTEIVVSDFEQAQVQHLRQQKNPVVETVFFPSSVCFYLVITLFHYFPALTAAQDIDEQLHPHFFLDTHDSRQGFLRSNTAIKFSGRVLANITIATIPFVGLSKIIENRLPTANGRLCELIHPLEFGYFKLFLLLTSFSFLEHLAIRLHVAITKKKQRCGG